MTTFGDGLRVGTATPLFRTVVGGPVSPRFTYNIVPLITGVSNLAAAATYSGATAAVTFVSTASGVTVTSINGVTYYDLGSERGITVSGVGASSLPITVNLSGLDTYLVALTTSFSGPTGTAAAVSPKQIRYLFPSATVSGNTVSSYSFGISDTVGFPFRVDAFEYLTLAYNAIGITSSAGWTAASSITQTSTTSGPRGSYTLQSAADGVKRYVADIFLNDVETITGLYGVTQA